MKQISVKLNIETYIKYRYICRCYYYRFMSRQLARLVAQFVADFEKEHGEISIEDFLADENE